MRTKILWSTAALLLAAAVPASAGAFTVIETGIISGSLGNVGFTNAQFTVTMFGDSANLGLFGGSNPGVTGGSGFIDIQGFNRVAPIAGDGLNILNFGGTVYLVDNGFSGFIITSPSLVGWNTATPRGPVTGAGGVTGIIPTTGGDLKFTSAGDFTLTEFAPEPSSAWLVSLAIGAVLCVAR